MNPAVVSTVQDLCERGDRGGLQIMFTLFPEHFRCIPLEDSDVSMTQAINDLNRENVVFNGGNFFEDGKLFLDCLTRSVEILTQPSYSGKATASEIAARVLCKASRTTSGSESYFSVQRLFSPSKYLVMPRGQGDELPPIDVQVFRIGRAIHSTVSCINLYGLYDIDEIERTSQSAGLQQPDPWLALYTVVVEKTDHYTGRNVRYLSISIDNEGQQQPSSPTGNQKKIQSLVRDRDSPVRPEKIFASQLALPSTPRAATISR